MNCIFICLFNNPNYINMLFLLLESIQLYGQLKDGNTEILIYTSTQFMKVIKLCPYPIVNQLTKFEINDNYRTVEKACKARLDLFDLLVPGKYNCQKNLYQKILYLDTDIIVKGNLQTIFDLCQKDKLYVLEEGSIDSDTDFWGKTLFQNAGDLELYTNKMDAKAFTSGILLFNNSETIKNLFSCINLDIIKRPFKFYCHDQPYIVYNAFKYDLYDNQALKPFAVNNDHDVCSSKTIHHFPGDPGMHQNKLKHMFAFLIGLKCLSI
jgi:lipopolysaccharide biosynthesis glycosyltransferase